MTRQHIKTKILSAVLFSVLAIGSNAQLLEGEINIKNRQPVDFLKSPEPFYPGEQIEISCSGEVNINPEEKTDRKCSEFFGIKLKCWNVRWTENHFTSYQNYPPVVMYKYLQGGAVPPGMSSEYSLSSAWQSAEIGQGSISAYTRKVQIKGFIPAIGHLDRNKSSGQYALKVKVDNRNRLRQLPNYLEYLKANDNITYENVRRALNKRMVDQFPVETAEALMDFVNGLPASQSGGQINELKRILKYAAEELAPGNLLIQNKLGEYYLRELDFANAESTLRNIINTINSTNASDYKSLELLGSTYMKLGEVYEIRELGISKADLTAAGVFYQKSGDHYIRAANFGKAAKAIMKQVAVLKKINTIATLKLARHRLLEAEHYYQQLYPFKEGNLYGFINKLGEEVIKAEYESVYSFDNDTKLATVKKDGKWGVITKSNRVAIDFKYDHPMVMSAALYAPFLENGKIGFIDRTGITSTNSRFDTISGNNQLKMDISDMTGRFQLLLKGQDLFLYLPSSNKEFRIFSPNDPPPAFDFGSTPTKLETYSPNKRIIKVGGKFGMVDANGNYIFPPTYEALRPWGRSNSPFPTAVQGPVISYTSGDKFVNGIPLSFFTGDYQEPPLIYRRGLEIGIMDVTGRKIYSRVFPGDAPEYFVSGSFNDLYQNTHKVDLKAGTAIVSYPENLGQTNRVLWKIENNQPTKLLGPFEIFGIQIDRESGIAVYNKGDGRMAVYSEFGAKKLFETEAQSLLAVTEELFLVNKGGKFGLVDMQGNQVTEGNYDVLSGINRAPFGINPLLPRLNIGNFLSWEAASRFYFKRGSESGIMDARGDVLVSYAETEVAQNNPVYLTDAYFYSHVQGQRGIYKNNGERVLSLDDNQDLGRRRKKYVEIQTRQMAGDNTANAGPQRLYFNINTSMVEDIDRIDGNIYRKGELWGLIDQEDNFVTQAIYEKLEQFSYNTTSGPSYFKAVKNGKTGLINRNGRVMIDFSYDNVLPVIPTFPWDELLLADTERMQKSLLKFYIQIPDAIKKFATGIQLEEYTDLCLVVLNGKMGYVNLRNEKIWMEN